MGGGLGGLGGDGGSPNSGGAAMGFGAGAAGPFFFGFRHFLTFFDLLALQLSNFEYYYFFGKRVLVLLKKHFKIQRKKRVLIKKTFQTSGS